MEALRQFGGFLLEQGMPTEPPHITREHVEAWLAALFERQASANTVATRYKALRVWFEWLLEDGEIRQSPMGRMKPPSIPDAPPPLLLEDQITRLLKACEGRSFDDRRA